MAVDEPDLGRRDPSTAADAHVVHRSSIPVPGAVRIAVTSHIAIDTSSQTCWRRISSNTARTPYQAPPISHGLGWNPSSVTVTHDTDSTARNDSSTIEHRYPRRGGSAQRANSLTASA